VPPSYAIISDYFPPGRRGTALGIFNLGPPIGAALGIAFGASIAAAFSWRHAFVVLGGVGILAAIALLLMVREPIRGGLDRRSAHAAERSVAAPSLGFRQTIAMFFSRRTLLLAALAAGANQFVTYGMNNFTTLFLMREKGMTLSDVALFYSLIVAVGMGGGSYLSGRLIDRYASRAKHAYALIPAIALALAVPLYVGFVWAPSWPLALMFLIGPTFFNHFYLSSVVTLVQQEVRPDQRVMCGALLLLVMNLIGLGLGPTYVGAASDYLRDAHPTNSLQIALYTLVPFYFIAIALFLWLARVLRAESRSPSVTQGVVT
jgi:predicted MFS family arabinose efflux permease